ncbi:MAG: ABC transporter ATP-binding protein [Candidatus Latescibacterota bacterium]
METMISFEDMTKRYGNRAAVSNIRLQVEKGEFFGCLGPNGAGKTTTIKSMIGLVRPDGGRVLIDGYDPALNPIEVRQRIGYAPDTPFLYAKLSAREFLRFVGGLYRMEPDDMERRIEWLAGVFDMHGWMDRQTEGYSHGMKQKVVMAAAFLHRPDLIIVDEPLVGLDPQSAKMVKDMLTLINSHGATVFMSSHDLSVVQELCRRMAILYRGEIVASGTIEELRSQAEMEGGSLEDLFLKLTGNARRATYLE